MSDQNFNNLINEITNNAVNDIESKKRIHTAVTVLDTDPLITTQNLIDMVEMERTKLKDMKQHLDKTKPNKKIRIITIRQVFEME